MRRWRLFWLATVALLYLLLATYQLGLPGLHYDEAKEAGVNAMELLNGEAVTAFREATVSLAGLQLPLMVQDYIGALNVYLTWPVLAVSGVGVPNLRMVGVLAGLAALLLLERTVSEWMVLQAESSLQVGSEHAAEADRRSTLPGPDGLARHVARVPISLAGLIAVTLLAASPSFVFWSRQGIFVTNITQPLSLLCIGLGLHWLRSGRGWALLVSAFAGGLAIYAKLLAIWLIAPFVLLAAVWWGWHRWRDRGEETTAPRLSLGLAGAAIGAFLIALTPLLLFNLETGGTWITLAGNASQSYYGVDNRQLLANLPVRLTQLAQSLRGDHFWYLGGLYGNGMAPWLGLILVGAGLMRRWQAMLAPLVLLTMAVVMSLFTVSDLFLTHYALLQPIAIGIIGIALALFVDDRQGAVEAVGRRRQRSVLVTIVLLIWLVFDLSATRQYHHVLDQTGGLGDHSDANYHLAYHLRFNGLGAPIALDWGFDAPVRFLTQGTVRPIEIFGYASPIEADADFRSRLEMFIHNPNNVYLLHAPEHTVFNGRRGIFMEMAAENGLQPMLETTFSQRDGTPLFELWRLEP